MGMFDYLRCGVKLDDRVGPNTSYQTKDLDCCLDDYWVDPAGYLWRVDTSGTYDFEEATEEELAKAREAKQWLPPFTPVPNNNHGRIHPVDLTRSIRIHASMWKHPKPDHSDWPEFELTFRDGKLILVQVVR